MIEPRQHLAVGPAAEFGDQVALAPPGNNAAASAPLRPSLRPAAQDGVAGPAVERHIGQQRRQQRVAIQFTHRHSPDRAA